jgi:hypothetical protein
LRTGNKIYCSFENWKQNLLYTLSLDTNFAHFLLDDITWGRKSKTAPLRGFTSDADTTPAAERRTAQQKVSHLELMLGQIANYCPVISRNTIVKNSTSVENIWQTIRLHFGFQTTGAHFIDFADIHLEANERPEDLFQRLTAFIEDNILKVNGITHHGEAVTEDEELSPSLENLVVLTWLRLIHTDLPRLVKQRYGTELRSRTLASIKPEISQALESLLDEIHTNESAKVMRASTFQQRQPRPSSRPPTRRQPNRSARQDKSCPLCKQAGRPDRHFLSECNYLPDQDRKYMLKARQIAKIIDDSEEEDYVNVDVTSSSETREPSPATRRVQVRQSPYIDVFYDHHSARITIDSGATGNMISLSTVKRFGASIRKSSQSARQADGSSPLHIIGETSISFTRDKQQLCFEGLIVENLDVDILAGTPFMECNDVSIRPAKRQVIFGNGTIYLYDSMDKSLSRHAIRRAHVIRAPATSTTVWPGDYLEINIPGDNPVDCVYALEPTREPSKSLTAWPQPSIVSSVAGKIRIPNLTTEPCFA